MSYKLMEVSATARVPKPDRWWAGEWHWDASEIDQIPEEIVDHTTSTENPRGLFAWMRELGYLDAAKWERVGWRTIWGDPEYLVIFKRSNQRPLYAIQLTE